MQGPEWIRGDLLGKGGFARVYSMQNTESGEFFAGKFSGIELPGKGKVLEGEVILKKMKKARDMLEEEINVHKTLEHPNIVKYISSFSTDSCYEEKEILVAPELHGACKVLVLEICPNKSLYDLLKTRTKITEEEARFYIYHIANALVYLRGKSIIHRDIKLGNIFLDAHLNPKIGDFGLAIVSSESKQVTGTPNYLAPEILTGRTYSFPVDTWALGVCLYTLLKGKPPFETSDVNTTYRRIRDNSYVRGLFSSKANDLINKIFVTDPNNRISIDEVLQHPFFTATAIMKEMPIEARVRDPNITEETPEGSSSTE